MSVTIITSISDALDRLSILDVKLKKIQDENKIQEIKKEKELIEKNIMNYKDQVGFYYNILLEINTKIWDLLDNAKYNANNDKEELENYRKQEDYNERRHRVKKKIDNLLSSKIKEQKGYKLKKAVILGHLGMGDQLDDIGIVRYLSTKYDLIYVISKNKYKKNVEDIYADDDSIQIIGVDNDSEISPAYGYPQTLFEQQFQNYDIYKMGFHKHGNWISYPSDKLYELPVSFYKDAAVPFYTFWKYFHIANHKEQKTLYNKLKDIKKYIFVHNTSSIGQIFDICQIEKKFDFNKDDVLIVNPCVNIYPEDHKFHNIAENFIFKDLIYYTTIIENASKVIVSDSAFCSMAIHLPIKTNECYIVYRREESYNYSYEHLWKDEKYKPQSNKYKVFTSLTLGT